MFKTRTLKEVTNMINGIKIDEKNLKDFKEIPPAKGGRTSKLTEEMEKLLNFIPKGKAYLLKETPEYKASAVIGWLKRMHKKGKYTNFKITQRKIDNKISMFIKHLPD